MYLSPFLLARRQFAPGYNPPMKLRPSIPGLRLLLLALSALLTLGGCEALSNPGAASRVQGLLDYSDNTAVGVEHYNSRRWYSDGSTHAQDLQARYDRREQ